LNSPLDFQPRTEAAGQRRNPRMLLGFVAGILGFAWACGDGTGPPPSVATVTITSSTAVEVVPGGTQMLTATAKDAKGNTLADRPVTWSSSDPGKATVVAGLVTGVALGSATITASVDGHDATVEAKVKDGGLVSSSGSTFSAQDGAVGVNAPAGAVSQTTSITVAPATSTPPSARLLSGTAFDFGPGGLTFGQPVTITIRYNPASLPGDSPESALQLYEVVSGSWRVVTGSTVNTGARTVSGAVSHVGTYAVMTLPKVATVAISGDQPAIPVVTTRQLTATLKDDEGTTLSRPVAWSSSNPAVLSIDPASGLATAKIPGSVTVTAVSEGKSGNATVNVVAGPPSKIVVNAGNNQSVAAGAAVPVAPSVKVTDAGDNPISGVAVTFAVASGGGSITGANATTDASGIATLGSWTLGPNAGPNSLTVTSPAISGVSLTFQAAAGAGPAANLVIFSGNGQTATAGGNIPNPPKVRVTDANGNFVAGFAVTFAPGPNSGSVTGGSTVTDASGIATVGSWKLGATAGAQTLIATAAGLNGSPLTITVTAVAPVPSVIAVAGGDNQTARPGFNVPGSPSFRVTDASGIPVAGVTVTFVVTEGGGSVGAPTSVTNADGIVQVTWTLGPAIGPNTMQASIPGGIPAASVHATAAALPPSRVALNTGDRQFANAGSAVGVSPSVRVTDIEGVGVAGVSVTFAVQTGGGSIQISSAVTNADGIASAGAWVVGLGPNTLTASVPGLDGNPVSFLASGLAQIQIVTFGDSNTDLGFQGTDPARRVSSYVSSADPSIRLSPYAPNSPLQLAGKIEAVWRANRSQTIRAVNHGISSTTSGSGRSIVGAPNAQQVVDGITRFQGEVLGVGYPWNGGEPQIVEGNLNPTYPNGSIIRLNAFRPRSSDFGYISIGTNDVYIGGASASAVRDNIQVLIDQWISAGLPPSHLFVTTLPPLGQSGSTSIQLLNTLIREFHQSKGVTIVDIESHTSSDGLHWSASTMHVGDFIHYSEQVRAWIADVVVTKMMSLTP
jgi:adhesin/invasin